LLTADFIYEKGLKWISWQKLKNWREFSNWASILFWLCIFYD